MAAAASRHTTKITIGFRIRRGLCNQCGKTFTFLPPFSPPYSHYSLIARSQALRRYFVEGCSWEASAPTVKDPDRVADPSTLRRWFRSLDCSRPAFSFLRPVMHARQPGARCRPASRPWRHATALANLFPFLNRLWPLRL